MLKQITGVMLFLLNSCTYMQLGAAVTEDTCAVSGMQAMYRRDYQTAIRSFDYCLSLNPGNAQLYFHRGTAYLMIQKPNIALVDLNMALRLDSGLYEAYYNRGLAQQALSNFTFSEADFLLYRQHVPADHKVLRNLALLMESMRDYPAAVSYYTEYLHNRPDYRDSLNTRADCREILLARASALAEMDSVNAAVSDLNICLAANQSDTAVWMQKGNIYYDARRYAEAIDAYNVILLLFPDNKAALINRADAYTASERYEEALRDYQALSNSDRYNPEYYFNQGFCYVQLEKNQEAILSLGKAMDTEYPNLGLLLTLRGVAYNNLHMQQEACADWTKAIQAGYREADTYKRNYCK